MFVSDLLGGNEITGFEKGQVYVNGNELPASYYELTQLCGNVPLGEVDSEKSYTNRVNDFENSCDHYVSYLGINDKYIIDNKLMAMVAYSYYSVNFEEKTLELRIDAYDCD